jgi:hypothetical protein
MQPAGVDFGQVRVVRPPNQTSAPERIHAEGDIKPIWQTPMIEGFEQ